MQIKCIIADDEPLARKVIKSYIEQIPYLSLMNEFDNAWSLKDYLQTHKVDLLFLDIEMSGLDGITFSKTLEREQSKIIYITAHRNYAVEAFEVKAIDYLLKPVSFERFLKAVEKFKDDSKVREVDPKHLKDHIYIPYDRKNVKICLAEIQYIEVTGDYLKLFMTKDKPLVFKYTLTKFMQELDERFLQIHRSFVINKDHISAYQKSQLQINETWLTVSRSFQQEVDRILNKFRIS